MSGRQTVAFDFTASFESTVKRYQDLSDGKKRDGDAYITHTVEAYQASSRFAGQSVKASDPEVVQLK